MNETNDKPLYVEFAEKVLGWTDIRINIYHSELYGHTCWDGMPPGSNCMRQIPRSDQAGYDLGPWEEKNSLGSGRMAAKTWIVDVTWGDNPEDGIVIKAETKREAVLRCLIALADAGKLVRP